MLLATVRDLSKRGKRGKRGGGEKRTLGSNFLNTEPLGGGGEKDSRF